MLNQMLYTFFYSCKLSYNAKMLYNKIEILLITVKISDLCLKWKVKLNLFLIFISAKTSICL